MHARFSAGSCGPAFRAGLARSSWPRSARQAEWTPELRAASRDRVQRSSTPILSPQAAAATEQAIEHYRDIVGARRLGAAADRRAHARRRARPGVVALRQRLIMTGDLDPAAGSSPVYDSYVEAGVRRFQARHGLGTTGAVNGADARGPERPGRRRACASSRSTSCACAPTRATSATAT